MNTSKKGMGGLTSPKRSIPVWPVTLWQLEPSQGNVPLSWARTHPWFLQEKKKEHKKNNHSNTKKGGKEVVRRFAICDKTTPRCWCTPVEERVGEGTHRGRLVKYSGDMSGEREEEGARGFTCGDDFIFGRIYIHISLSLTGSRQEAGLAGDILFIIIWFHASSSIRARQPQMMWFTIEEKQQKKNCPVVKMRVSARCFLLPGLKYWSTKQNKETKQLKYVLPLWWKHWHTIQQECFSHFCRHRLNTGVVVSLSVFCNYCAAELSSEQKGWRFNGLTL